MPSTRSARLAPRSGVGVIPARGEQRPFAVKPARLGFEAFAELDDRRASAGIGFQAAVDRLTEALRQVRAGRAQRG